MANEIGNNVTGTSNQAKMPENDIEVKVTLEFGISNDGVKRSHEERLDEIKAEMREMGISGILNSITDYEVE